jgi:hypothetical protein
MTVAIRKRVERLERRTVGAPVLAWRDDGDDEATLSARVEAACRQAGVRREAAQVCFIGWAAMEQAPA